MFEAAETGAKVAKEDYEDQIPALRVDLLNAQFDLRSADFPVLILISGDDRAGCNQAIDLLHEWMDARYMETHVIGEPTQEESERPRFWRYWRAAPARGQIGVFLGAWAFSAVADRVLGRIDDGEFDRRVEHGQRFEDALVDDGALVLRFWIHLSAKDHKKRHKKAKKHPERLWRSEDRDWDIYEDYETVMPVVERYLRKTSTARAPWHVVEGTDKLYRNLRIVRTILREVTARLNQPPRPEPVDSLGPIPSAHRGALDEVDLSPVLPRDEYRKRRDKLQDRIYRYSLEAREQNKSSVLVFEGWDAAGKGGAIRRITQALDARDYRVIPIAAPTDEEKAHHYLWRFWRKLPRAGRMVIFDRTWYGRVLVERVEGFARPDEWRRAYAEINDFEAQLVEHGMLVLKFWLHIDPEEQLRRFQEREKTPYKKYKLTEEDYRNRDKWPDYVVAVNDMVVRTSTPAAPWHLVAANDKRVARIQVLEAVAKGLKQLVQS